MSKEKKPFKRITMEDLAKLELYNIDAQARILNKLLNKPKENEHEINQTNRPSK